MKADTSSFNSIIIGHSDCFPKNMALSQSLRVGLGIFFAVYTLAAFTAASEKSPTPEPIFREDLHHFGYPTRPSNRGLADYTDLAFLRDNLILVSLNLRAFGGSAEDLNTAKPESTLLVFDLTEKRLLKSSRMPIEKFYGSVHATTEGRFVILNRSEIKLCDANLECGPPKAIPGEGPLLVSPKGTRIIAGGNGQNLQELLDADSLTVLNRFPFGQGAVPGDTAILSTRDRQIYLVRDAFPDRLLGFPGRGDRLHAQFLSDSRFAIFESDQLLAVVGLDGKTSYNISILPYWSGTDVVPAPSGNRFCVHQKAYTVWGSRLSVADDHRTRNVDIYRVFDTSSGTEVFHFQWDPRPYFGTTISPALSPSGHRLAVIRSGYLEVFELR